MQYPFDSKVSFEGYVKDALTEFRREVTIVAGPHGIEGKLANAFTVYVVDLLGASVADVPLARAIFDELQTNQLVMRGALAFRYDALLLTKFDRLVNNLSFGVKALYGL